MGDGDSRDHMERTHSARLVARPSVLRHRRSLSGHLQREMAQSTGQNFDLSDSLPASLSSGDYLCLYGREHNLHRQHLPLGDTYYWKRHTAEPAVQTYAPGSTVFVSFDPSRPERSVLEPGVTPDAVSRIEWFLPILLIAAWMVRMDLKRVRARRLIQSKRPVKFHV